MTVKADSGVVRYRVFEIELEKPAIGVICFDFLFKLAFRPDPVQVSQQYHFEQYYRVDGGSAVVFTVVGANLFFYEGEVDVFVYFS